MNELTVFAAAKINLSLDIIGKREDSYHLLDSVMQSISIYDIVNVRKNVAQKINITCSNKYIPCDERNIAHKAAVLFFDYVGISDEYLDIDIKKAIPSQAGLGGGSADAAAVIAALDIIYGTKLGIEQKTDLASKVGADVAFCLGGTMRAKGIGQDLTEIVSPFKYYIAIAKGKAGVSTAKAYEKYDETETLHKFDTQNLIDAFDIGDFDRMVKSTGNQFESVINLPEVDQIKKIMKEHGALAAHMSGSGSAVYGIFINEGQSFKCVEALKKLEFYSAFCHPVDAGLKFK